MQHPDMLLGEQIKVSNYIYVSITGTWLQFLSEDDSMGQQNDIDCMCTWGAIFSIKLEL